LIVVVVAACTAKGEDTVLPRSSAAIGVGRPADPPPCNEGSDGGHGPPPPTDASAPIDAGPPPQDGGFGGIDAGADAGWPWGDDGGSPWEVDAGDGGYYEFDAGPPPPPPTPYPWVADCPGEPTSSWEVGPVRDLATMGSLMLGRWTGHAKTNLGWAPIPAVAMSFTADGPYAGRYSAMCLSAYCRAFYYGTDADSPLKQYRLNDVGDAGRALGEIDIVDEYGDQFGDVGWQGELHNIEIDATGNRLRFHFWRSDGYGPIRYDLWRCPSN
jgi:hypothetical protein